MPQGKYYESSLAAFRRFFPDIAARIEAEATPLEEIIEDGEIVDVRIGDKRLYGENGVVGTQAQVETFVKDPRRFLITDLRKAGMGSPVCARMIERMYREAQALGPDAVSVEPVEGFFYLCVFGIGLGYHLAPLHEQLKPRWMFVIEPMVQLIHHSLGAIDWQAFLEKAEADGTEVVLIVDSDPDRIAEKLGRLISKRGSGFFEGSYVYQHYPLWTLSAARQKMVEAMHRRFIAAGFYEDELVMMTNATANFRNNSGHVIDGRPMRLRPEPVFIVGSGPSADEAMPVIKRFRDRAVVVSCGSSLRVLLKNGIVPNFHVEIENTPETVDALNRSAQFGDLKQVTLICSCTVDPRVPGMFREAVFFFRDSVSSTMIMGGRFKDVFGGSPTVANTALAMASLMGFTKYYFFGVDCGVLPGGEHHSKDSMYYDGDDFKEYIETTLKYPITVRGNFGGAAHTEITLNASRVLLGTVIRLRGLEAYNCSDGCLIEHTIPLLPECVNITTPPIDWATIDAACKAQMFPFKPGDILSDVDRDALIQGLHDFHDELIAIVDRVVEAEPETAVPAIYREVVALEQEIIGRFANSWSIALGSVRTLPRIGMFFISRLRDPEHRRKLTEAFIEEYRARLVEMRDGAEALVREKFPTPTPKAAAA